MITVITTHSTKIIGKINRLLGRTTTTIGLSYCNSTTILNLCCTKFSNNDSQLTLNENFVQCKLIIVVLLQDNDNKASLSLYCYSTMIAIFQMTIIILCLYNDSEMKFHYHCTIVVILTKLKMLRNHRDFKRVNKANSAVKGIIFLKINLSSINKIEDIIDAATPSVDHERILGLLRVAKNSNNMASTYLLQSQEALCNTVATSYAHQQFMQMVKSEDLNEDYKSVDSISKFIVSDDMIEMNKSIMWGDQSGMFIDVQYYIHHFDSSPTHHLLLIVL